MLFCQPNNLVLLLQKPKRKCISFSAVRSDLQTCENSENTLLCSDRTKERIREMFNRIEISVSSYDTAWVAMIPSQDSPGTPYFPQCINWLLENQHPDGSWGLPHRHPLMVKDTLLSTLASTLALNTWNIGEDHVNKGLQYITSTLASATDEKQHNPIGFDIIFTGMMKIAQEMGINLQLDQADFNSLLRKRDLELNRGSACNSEGRKLYLAYVAEGLGSSPDWKNIMNYQRKNGSLFNSPSTTAAAVAQLHDNNSLNYLRLLLDKFGNAVPTVCPRETYTQLCLVDSLESLGIARHFKEEIKNVLDKTYSCWLAKDEQIFLDIATCAMAFRILRLHGYDISSDALAQFGEEGFSNTLEGYLKDTGAVLELYRASHLAFPGELFLDELKFWSGNFLKQELSKASMHADRLHQCIRKEVDIALNYSYYANLQRLENRRTVEHYNTDNLRIMKTSYRPLNIDNKALLGLAVEDFNLIQSMMQREFKQIERWVKENRLDKLTFARQKQAYCYFSSAASLFIPELSDARLSLTKTCILSTVVDDFYDGGGSKDEQLHLIQLVEKWNGVSATDFTSEQVEIIFTALQNTVNELGEKAFKWQRRDVTSHIVQIWVTLIKSMMIEAAWLENKTIPTIHEYNTNAYVSFALGPIVLPALYLVGHYLSEDVVRSPEYHNLFRLMSTCGRNLNDIQGFKKDKKAGKLNGVSLLMIHDPAVSTKEEAMRKLMACIDSSRNELMELVLKTTGSVVPRACKDLFWDMCRGLHLFYESNDGYTSTQQMVGYVNDVLFIPLQLPEEMWRN